MAVVTTVSNHFEYMKATKEIDFSNDTFVAILMNTTFTFDKTTHATYADISSDELATGNGYTQKSKTLTGVSVTENDTLGGVQVTWDDISWAASGGSIGATGACCIIDDTTSDDTVVMCIDFGLDLTAVSGLNLIIQDPEYRGLTS